MISRHVLSTGETRYSVRVMRYGKRHVLGRFNTPNEAVSAAVREYASYLARVWIDNQPKSTNDGPLSSAATEHTPTTT